MLKIVDSATCFYCKAHDANIAHMFCTCNHAKQFGKDSTDICIRNKIEITLSSNDVLYGVEDITICNVIFSAKTLVYNRRIRKDKSLFSGFMNHLDFAPLTMASPGILAL